MNNYLLERDTVDGSEGVVVLNKNGKNYEVAGLRKLEAFADIQSTDMKVIGTKKIQEKPTGAKLGMTGNMYYGSTMFTDMCLEYVNTGVSPHFDILITNNDPSTSIGERVMGFYGCQLVGKIPLSVLDSEEAMLNFDFSFTYTEVRKIKDFKAPERLGAN